jgi:hypothetical protein
MLTTIRLQPLRELISSPPYFFRNLFSPWTLAFLLGAVFFRSLFSPINFQFLTARLKSCPDTKHEFFLTRSAL